jgi:limonene-1,2-epoxide hydrolase
VSGASDRPMTTAESVARALFAAWHAPDLEHILGFFAEGASFTEPYGRRVGLAEIRAALEPNVAAVRSVEPTLVRVAADGDRVVIVERVERVQVDGAVLVVQGVVVIEVDADGKIIEFRDYFDPASIATEPQPTDGG